MARQQFRTTDRFRVEVQEPWTTLANLVLNPSPVEDTSGWSPWNSGVALTATAGGLQVASEGSGAAYSTTSAVKYVSGLHFRAFARRGGGTPGVGLVLNAQQINAAGLVIDDQLATTVTTTTGNLSDISATAVLPDTVAFRLLVFPPYGTVVAKDITLVVGSTAELSAYVLEPERSWIDVTNPTTECEIERDELQVGVLTAQIADSALDPATLDLIRPGRAVRASALVGSTWERLFGGTLLTATVNYELKKRGVPDERRSRITMTATDDLSLLANTPRPSGVATIDELPFVLDGSAVPWNVNGSTGGIDPDTVTIVSSVEAASAVDQVAITRDTVRGYAWLDRKGVLQAWDAAEIDTTVADILDEDVYAEAAVDFDTQRCINTVSIKLLTIDAEGATQEESYGPFVDADSVRKWGARSAEFTVHGLDVDDLDDYAAGILAAASTPAVKVNEVTIPLRSAAELEAHVLRDLYDLVTVQNARAGLDQDLRVVSVKHRIAGRKWLIDLGFAADESVAPPQVTPSPTQPTAVTLAQRLRPVGEVTMWYGAAVDCPAGWLICDGTPFTGADFPLLEDVLGGTTLPNLVDRFPIGAGVKALGASGGAATKTIAAANLPPHDHEIPRADAVGGNVDTVARGGATTVASSETGDGGFANTPLDVMPPWRALHFIIRAR